MGKAMRFPCDKVYHKMGIWWKKSIHTLEGKMGTNFPGSFNSMDFTAFSHAMGNWWGNPCVSHMIKYTIECEYNGKKYPYSGESMSAYFPGSPHTMSSVGFSREPISQVSPHVMGSWWENTCISYMIKYTTGWESNGKNHQFYGKGVGTNFSGLSHSMSFADFSNAMGNLMRKPMYFPCSEVYHKMGI